MIRVGDKVRHWSRVWNWDQKDWRMMISGVDPLTVVHVLGPLGEREPYYQITCALPPPYDQACHYNYYHVRETRRWWQLRNNGTALNIVARAPLTPQQGDLFEAPRKVA